MRLIPSEPTGTILKSEFLLDDKETCRERRCVLCADLVVNNEDEELVVDFEDCDGEVVKLTTTDGVWYLVSQGLSGHGELIIAKEVSEEVDGEMTAGDYRELRQAENGHRE